MTLNYYAENLKVYDKYIFYYIAIWCMAIPRLGSHTDAGYRTLWCKFQYGTTTIGLYEKKRKFSLLILRHDLYDFSLIKASLQLWKFCIRLYTALCDTHCIIPHIEFWHVWTREGIESASRSQKTKPHTKKWEEEIFFISRQDFFHSFFSFLARSASIGTY